MPLRVVLAHEPWLGRTAQPIAHAPLHLCLSSSNSAATVPTPVFGRCVLDEALESTHSPSDVVIAVAARSYAWFSQWASARNVSQTFLLNTGATDPKDINGRSPWEVVSSSLRHAAGPIMSPAGSPSKDPFPLEVTHALSGRRLIIENALSFTSAQPQLDALCEYAQPPEATVTLVEGAVLASSFARVGLMGNPSDQLHGRAMAVTVDNFSATVLVEPSTSGALEVMPHPVADASTFGSLADISSTTTRNGYAGGMRIVLAACKRFYMLVLQEKKLNPDAASRPFRLWYDTNVPRQVGLAGSSCIVSAVFKALAQFFRVELDLHSAPSAVLAAEWDELGIHAGLMDRVVQVWGGLVAMDFDKAYLTEHGYGKYNRMDLALLPPLYLAYAMDPSDSGKIHSNVKERYFRGDEEVIRASQTWRGFVGDAIAALERGDTTAFADLADRNFDLRRQLYGDQCLGWKNLHMIEIARRHGASAKLPGSGGAILVISRGADVTDVEAMREELERHDYVLIRLQPCCAPS